MLVQEAVLCATGRAAANPISGAITLHDFQTGATFASFKQTTADQHCTAVIDTKDGQGGFMLASQIDKSLINVYNFQKDQLSLKIVVPEKLSCIAIDKHGQYCAGGTLQGRIFLWEVCSGILYNVWDAHYRRVSVLRFTHDAGALISGSEDSGVSVWSLSSLVDDELQNEVPTPYCSFSDHTLPITDIACGVGIFPSCRILTSSLDHSAKLFDLGSRSLLTTFLFPKPITQVVFELVERSFFAASSDGCIHQVDLFRQRGASERAIGLEAIGGGGTDAIRIDDEQEGTKRLINVGQQVTSMALSFTSSSLLVGTAAGLIHIYDIASLQLLRSISTHKGSPITHLQSMVKPLDLVGHASLTMNVRGAVNIRDILPPRPVVPFQRIRDPKTRESHEVLMILPPSSSKHEDPATYEQEEFLRDYNSFMQVPPIPAVKPQTPNPASTSEEAELQAKQIAELKEELQELQNNLKQSEELNKTLLRDLSVRLEAEARQRELRGDPVV